MANLKLKCGPVRFSNEECGEAGFPMRRPVLRRPPPRFTIEEWSLAGTLVHNAALSSQESADRVQAESIRVADESREVTLRAQEDIDWKFKQRFQEMTHWRDEIDRDLGKLNNEIDAMIIYRQRLENALTTLCNILEVNSQILSERECRFGVDLVHDEPQKQVLHEMKVVESIQNILKRNVEYCTEQLRLLRKCTYVIGKQLLDKDKALEIDKMAYNLDEHRAIVQRQCDPCMTEVSNNITENDWIAATERSKREAEKTANASIQLRSTVDSILRQICEDLQKEICLTNMLFERRLKEVIDAKGKLEEQHASITIKVREMDGALCKLSKAFEEKQGAIALAETRACIRAQRPNQELIQDPLQRRLLYEIEEENEQMSKINRKIIEANITLRTLQRNQLELEDAINIKMHTIGIDETKIIPIRKTIRVQEY